MKIKNKVGSTLFVMVLTSVFLSGCTKNFEEINQDPIRPAKANQGNMLGQLEYQLVNATISISKEFTHELMQVTAPRESSSGGIHRYQILPNDGTGIWNAIYARSADLNDLAQISEQTFPNYQAVSLILKAWS